MTRHTTFSALFCWLLLSAAFSGSAQTNDTLAVYRDFIRASRAWQQQPLQLDIEMTNHSNVVTREEDTITTMSSFYIGAQSAYIRFGELEQLVNDSQALIISNKLKRMIFYSNATSILAAAKSLRGLMAQDSSLLHIAGKYTAREIAGTGDNRNIVLNSRKILYGTALPAESVEMNYDIQTGNPSSVITTKRTLIPLTREDYTALSQKPGNTGKLVHSEEDKCFMIKELVNTTVYKKISHDPNVKIPFTIADRIGRSSQGNLLPAKAYEQYTITVN